MCCNRYQCQRYEYSWRLECVQKDENVITVLEGLKMVSPNTHFEFVDQGWDPRNMSPKKVNEAAEKAKSADLNIELPENYMMRFRWTERTGGEDTDVQISI
jgi:beta-glucosidase